MNNSSGSFGSNANRGTRTAKPREKVDRKFEYADRNPVLEFLSRISPENWVDIICCSLIAVFLIVVACNWAEFSEALFLNILFPIIYIASKIITFFAILAALVGAVVFWIKSKFRRRWFW